jgi:hypothetical protein
MPKARIIAVFIIAATFNSCQKKDNTPPAPAVNQLMELKVGKNWSYANTEFNEDGTVKLTGNNKLVITDTVVKNNKTYFVLKDAAFLNDTLLLIRADEKAVFAYSEDNNIEFTYFKWPVTDGEILYSITNGPSKEEGIASTSTLIVNNMVGYKVTHNLYLNNQINKYSELYFRPTTGIGGTVDYRLKSASTDFYKSFESRLISFSR